MTRFYSNTISWRNETTPLDRSDADDTPYANLRLTVLDKAGVPADTLGDSTGLLHAARLSL